jgi:hypothetical protein
MSSCIPISKAATPAAGGGDSAPAVMRTLRSAPSANGLVTELRYQDVGTLRYFDAAGFAGRTVGL